ncbi:hypothetical protein [Methylovorus glucosotrophus]|uniref:Uncharacterized protein n=1 Tax=Methylovorus glucosotrophus (strain SIP3-4) TaxID=582744 RepID=C6X7V1_METGS|nr:hypothetical protein [Methylovorus glucosotrophus]ACT51278.1 conserved hypothetical protein [Methylovorus glucosotrophus SIP3-4]
MKSKLLLSCLILISLTACKKEESATDILDQVAIPPKKEVVAPKPVKPKAVELIKKVAPAPTINEPIKIVPIVENKPITPIVVAKPPVIEVVKPIPKVIVPVKPVIVAPVKQEVVKPVAKVESVQPIAKPVDKKGEVVMSIEFE